MEPEGSIPCSQGPSTGPYPELHFRLISDNIQFRNKFQCICQIPVLIKTCLLVTELKHVDGGIDKASHICCVHFLCLVQTKLIKSVLITKYSYERKILSWRNQLTITRIISFIYSYKCNYRNNIIVSLVLKHNHEIIPYLHHGTDSFILIRRCQLLIIHVLQCFLARSLPITFRAVFVPADVNTIIAKLIIYFSMEADIDLILYECVWSMCQRLVFLLTSTQSN
jgi:hypothetical protein